MSQSHYTSIIIGSGQSGSPLATALRKSSSSHSVLLIERSFIGGTCINYGCTPTKTLISTGRVKYLIDRASDYGVILPEGKTTVDMQKFRQRKRDIVKSFRGGNERRLKDAGVEVVFGTGSFVDEKTVKVELNDGGEKVVTADQVFVNTGARPTEPGVPGVEAVDKDRILDSTSIMELDVLPEHLIVVGGGYIGMEFGQLFKRLGSQVTVVTRGGQIVPKEDKEIADSLTKILEEDGMKIMVDTNTTQVKKSEKGLKLAVKSKGGKEETIEGTHILFAAGRTPNTDMLNLSSAGVKTDDKGFIKVDEFLQTGAKGIYALGDVKGGPAFTHISYDDYRIINNNVVTSSTKQLSTTNRQVPYTVYTDPQLGHIGLHEAEARKQYPDRTIQTAKMPMEYVARALETDEARGLMKAVVDKDSGEIYGFTCLGLEGGEIMSMVQVAMMGGVKWWDLRDATFAHPALAESLNNLWGFLE